MLQRCVVLDGFTLTEQVPGGPVAPGEPSWEPLAKLVELAVFPRTTATETGARGAQAQLLLTNKVVLGRTELEAFPELRYIGVLATGTNVVDLEAARERGIVVTNVPGYAAESVVSHVFGLILELSVGVAEHAQATARGDWQRSPDFCFRLRPTTELWGKTLGLVGLGNIGRRVAQVASAFGMRVLAAHSHSGQDHAPEGVNVTFCDLARLFAEADVLSLHCPLVPSTRALVNAERLATMKPSAIVINTGRGPLIDELALAQALCDGRIAGAGLDVLSVEPPGPDNPLLTAPNCLVTPHMAWATQAARHRLMNTVVDNVAAYLRGTPQNRVNG
jgi:glycerate dehydrogenase